MGMAASQARLLSITARLNNIELQSQNISNAKLRLADSTDAASDKYVKALNKTHYLYNTYNATGDVVSTALTGASLTNYGELKNQYGLVNTAGEILVSERDKNLILIVLDQLSKRNIRLYLNELKHLLLLENYPNDLKAIILELLVEQGIMDEVKVSSNGKIFEVDLSTLTPLMEQISIEEILKLIEEKIDNKDITIFNACQDLLIAYHASIYPLAIEEDEYSLVAAGVYYAALTNYGIDEDIEKVAVLFGVKSKFIEIYYENICKLSIF